MSTQTANSLLSFRLIGSKIVQGISTEDAPGDIVRLTRGLAAGDETAFREFHTLYFDRLYQFLLAVTRGQEHEAQEALQQTLLRVVRYARVFDSEDVFWSWLKALGRSAARDAGRKQQRYSALLQNFALRWRQQSEQAPTDGGDRLCAALKESLDELDPTRRTLLEAKYLDGTTVKELCLQAGVSEKALESRLLRLRQELRQRVLAKLRLP